VQQEHRDAGEHAADHAGVAAELLDDRAVEVVDLV
jgi:hypothetical protein